MPAAVAAAVPVPLDKSMPMLDVLFPLPLLPDDDLAPPPSDFIHKFKGASPSSVSGAIALMLLLLLPLKFKPVVAHSLDESKLISFVADDEDLDKLYAPFELIVGGNLITSTRSL